ncbi:MAG: DnaJ domain-containing protein [Myxococcota bacterium]|nr:DnaJ domain-containing protein [Myxococcota bacterium]
MSSAIPDYYAILGVAKDSDAAEIKKKFRRLARGCHPDVAGDDPEAAARFTQLREAYETLIDPIRRDRYDNPPKRRTFYRQSWRPPGGNEFGAMGEGGTGHRSSRQRWRDPANNLDLDDIFGGFATKAPSSKAGRASGAPRAEPRGDFTRSSVRVTPGSRTGATSSKSGAHERAPAMPGESVRQTVEVSERIARLGGTVTLNYPRLKRGDGGTSLFRYNEIYDLRLTPDTRSGEEVRIPRMGNAGVGGGAYGELVCTIQVKADAGAGNPRGRRDAPKAPEPGADIDLPISIAEALLGGRVEVDTPSGRVRLSLPPCSSSGTRLRLRGRGLQGSDIYVCLRIVVPQALDEESRQLIEQFAALNPDSPR